MGIIFELLVLIEGGGGGGASHKKAVNGRERIDRSSWERWEGGGGGMLGEEDEEENQDELSAVEEGVIMFVSLDGLLMG